MVAIEVPLEDLYKGTTRSLRLNRQKVVNGRLVDDPKILEVRLLPDGSGIGTIHCTLTYLTFGALWLEHESSID